MEPLYRLSGAEIRAAQDVIRAVTLQQSQWAAGSEREKICGIYFWLLENVSYGMGTSDGQTIFDALVLRQAVCKGLAKSMQFLLGQMEVPVWLCSGTLDGTTRHIWNAVKLDGTVYNVDVSPAYPCFDSFFTGAERQDRSRGLLLLEEQRKQLHQHFRTRNENESDKM